MFSGASILKSRFLAAGIRFLISIAIALMAALLIFGLWFPYPYRSISGGLQLFLLLVGIDFCVGLLLTFVVFNRAKPLKELRRDMVLIGLLQLSILAYGFWSVAVSRPVHLVFEFDRFRVVHAVDVPEELLDKAPSEFRSFSLTGPGLLSLRDFHDAKEHFEMTMAALQGLQLSARPELWAGYDAAKPQVLAEAKPLDDLKKRFPDRIPEIDAALKDVLTSGGGARSIAYLPIISRDTFWTAFIDANTAEVIAFVPIDPY